VSLELPKGAAKAEAMAAVERAMEARMRFALEEWQTYLAWKSSAQAAPPETKRGNSEDKI
jgi:hypothetical protein